MCIRCTCKRISLRLIITSSMSFVETFLWSRSRHLPRSRDRSRTRQQVDVEKEGNPKRGQRDAAGRRGGAREDVQTESGSAWAENRALSSLVDILPLPGLRHVLRGSRTENTPCLGSGSRSCAIGPPIVLGSSGTGSTSASTSTSRTPHPREDLAAIGSRSTLPRSVSIAFRIVAMITRAPKVFVDFLSRCFAINSSEIVLMYKVSSVWLRYLVSEELSTRLYAKNTFYFF